MTATARDPRSATTTTHRDLTVAHAAIVPVSASGEVCIFDNVATNLVVDITGRFGAAAGIGDATSTRLIDTRDRGAQQPAPRRSRSRSAPRPPVAREPPSC